MSAYPQLLPFMAQNKVATWVQPFGYQNSPINVSTPTYNHWGIIPEEHLLSSPGKASPIRQDGSPKMSGSVVFHERLGSGVFGEVWKGEYRGSPVAVKVTSCPTGFREEELELLRKNQGAHVVKLIAVEQTVKGTAIIMELCEGSLQDQISKGHCDGEEAFLSTCCSILEGLCAIHETGTIFGDLKPDNILVRMGGELLFADFGDARDGKRDHSRRLVNELGWGSPMYHARPDVMKKNITYASDIWMFAQTAIHLWQQQPATFNPSPMPHDIPMIELLQQCLSVNPSDRPTAEVALREAKFLLRTRPEGSQMKSPSKRRGSLPASLPSHHSPLASPERRDLTSFRRRISTDGGIGYYSDPVTQEFEARMSAGDGGSPPQWMDWQGFQMRPPPPIWLP